METVLPQVRLTPEQAKDARDWLAAGYTPAIAGYVAGDQGVGFTPEKAQQLSHADLEAAVGWALTQPHGWRFEFDKIPDSLAKNGDIQAAYAERLVAYAGIDALPRAIKDNASLMRSLGARPDQLGARPKYLLKNSGLSPESVFNERLAQRYFVQRWSPPGTLEKADNLPIHQREAYVAMLAEKILDTMPSSQKVNEKTFKARVDADGVLAEAAQVKGWRQVQDKLPADTRWAAFKLGQAKIEATEQLLNDPAYGAPLGLEGVNPFRGYSHANTVALAAAFGHDLNDRWPYNIATKRANNLAAYNIATLFGKDLQGAVRFVEGYAQSRNRLNVPPTKLHDAGQFTLPQGQYTKDAWAKYLTAHPGGMKYLAAAPAFEREFGRVPSGEHELRAFSIAQAVDSRYATNPKAAMYVQTMAEAGLSAPEIQEALGYASRAKEVNDIPEIRIEGQGPAEGFTIRQLEPGDFRALTIGQETECCQRLGSAGQACAIHSFEEPSSGVFVVESKDGQLVAESWAWLSADRKTVVFDSVESQRKDAGAVNATAELISALAAELNKQGYKTMLSDTSYGMTKDVAKAMGLTGDKSEKAKVPPMAVYSAYSDAEGKIYTLDKHLERRAERLERRAERLEQGLPGIPVQSASKAEKDAEAERPPHAQAALDAYGATARPGIDPNDRLGLAAISLAKQGNTQALAWLLSKDLARWGNGHLADKYLGRAAALELLGMKAPGVREALISTAKGISELGRSGVTDHPASYLFRAALEKGDVGFVRDLLAEATTPELPREKVVGAIAKNSFSPYMSLDTWEKIQAEMPDLAKAMSAPEKLAELARNAVVVGNYKMSALAIHELTKADELRHLRDFLGSPGLPRPDTTREDMSLVAKTYFARQDTSNKDYSKRKWAERQVDEMWGAALKSERLDMIQAVKEYAPQAPALGIAQTEKQATLAMDIIKERNGAISAKDLDWMDSPGDRAGRVAAALPTLLKAGVDASALVPLAAKVDLSARDLAHLKANGVEPARILGAMDVDHADRIPARVTGFLAAGLVLDDGKALQSAIELGDISSKYVVGYLVQELGATTKGITFELPNQGVRGWAHTAVAALLKHDPEVVFSGPGKDAVLADVVGYSRDPNLVMGALERIEDKTVLLPAIDKLSERVRGGQQSFAQVASRSRSLGYLDGVQDSTQQLLTVVEHAARTGGLTPADLDRKDKRGRLVLDALPPDTLAAVRQVVQEMASTGRTNIPPIEPPDKVSFLLHTGASLHTLVQSGCLSVGDLADMKRKGFDLIGAVANEGMRPDLVQKVEAAGVRLDDGKMLQAAMDRGGYAVAEALKSGVRSGDSTIEFQLVSKYPRPSDAGVAGELLRYEPDIKLKVTVAGQPEEKVADALFREVVALPHVHADAAVAAVGRIESKDEMLRAIGGVADGIVTERNSPPAWSKFNRPGWDDALGARQDVLTAMIKSEVESGRMSPADFEKIVPQVTAAVSNSHFAVLRHQVSQKEEASRAQPQEQTERNGMQAAFERVAEARGLRERDAGLER